ncbi:MAG: hypothetical protein KA163_05065 [Bacteroidia bacterium]|nr:hypothetical protein [Bacteroidia bacterium]
MIVLLDLDGTLTNTAEKSFKPMKDGLEDTVISKIPAFAGAREFVQEVIKQGHTPIIISDSHPKYVNPIAEQIFGIAALSLADKPNSKKTIEYLMQKGYNINEKDNFIIIGDTWLDIELGRALNFKTILTQFYYTTEVDERDGIGKTWHQLKSGPTYFAKQFAQILNILANPMQNLWAAEGVFHDIKSIQAIRLHDSTKDGPLTIFRSLGRQDDGECDKYGIAFYYKEFQRENRSIQALSKLSHSIEIYLESVFKSAPNLKWDYITYVSDKSTTAPPNKMKIFFELIKSPIPKVQLFKWLDDVDGSIRNRINYRERRDFIAQNLNVIDGIELDGKSIIVIDDQFTSGGTAYEVVNMLRKKGATNILFVTLFFMISRVLSIKVCPKCSQQMQIKIRKSDGIKFFSCTPPQFKGNGCGHSENII